jgi:pimeloyl-ACP methyl ester carboxylesterase
MNHEAWSAAQSETTVTVDGHDLSVAYYEGGPDDGSAEGGAGTATETLVFLHGIPTWSFLWRRIAPGFEGEYRVVVPDLVGYGNSDRRDCFDRSIRAQEVMLEALLDELGETAVTLVGHDIGGGIALRLAAHSPGRVDRFVASNAVCYDSWPVEFVTDLGLPETVEMDDEDFEARLDFAFAEGTYGEADPEFVAGMKAPWLREDGKRALSRAAVATNTNHTTEIDYDAVEADVLCLWGGEDAGQPVAIGERLATDLGGEVVELADAYHWVIEDRPEAYREALREFLTQASATGGDE